jgi:hypothetical protein
MGAFSPYRPVLITAVLVLVWPLLAGCAAAPTVVVARLALDGVSLVATGKTSNGHGLSAMSGEDCEPIRVLEDELVCRPADYPDSDARLSQAIDEPRHTAFGGVFAEAAHEDVMIDPAMLPEFTALETPEPYVVIASFSDEVDARAVAWHLTDLPATTSAKMVDGVQFYRVVVGPLDSTLEPVLAARLAKAGVMSFYPVLLCPGDHAEPPCIGKPRYRPLIEPDKVAAVEPR